MRPHCSVVEADATAAALWPQPMTDVTDTISCIDPPHAPGDVAPELLSRGSEGRSPLPQLPVVALHESTAVATAEESADLTESYQAHFLVDEADEPEYVAHVDLAKSAATIAPLEPAARRSPHAALQAVMASLNQPASSVSNVDEPAEENDSALPAAETEAEPPVATIAAAVDVQFASEVAIVPEEAQTELPLAVGPTATQELVLPDAVHDEIAEEEPTVLDDVLEIPEASAEAFADVQADTDAPKAVEVEPGQERSRKITRAARAVARAAVREEPSDDLLEEAAAGAPALEASIDDEYQTQEEQADEELIAAGSSGGAWTIPLLCAGIAIIACCLIIPQADANRRMAYDRDVLRTDLETVQAQVATNDEFLRKLAGDPSLAERLAQRQMKLMRPGTRILPIGQGDAGTSPFDLVQVSVPQPKQPYMPVGGAIASLCYNPHTRLYLMGGGLFLMAAAMVLGAGGGRERRLEEPPLL